MFEHCAWAKTWALGHGLGRFWGCRFCGHTRLEASVSFFFFCLISNSYQHRCPQGWGGGVRGGITVLTYYALFVGKIFDDARLQVSELKKLEEWWLQNLS